MRQSENVSSARSLLPSPDAQAKHTPQSGFRDDIEGLRGFTLLAIVGWHISMPGVSGGFVGPDIFFEISGFVITGQLWKQVSTTGTVGLKKFYGARSRRLLPVSATIGVITAIAAAFLLPVVQAQSALKDAIACALYVPNFWFIVQQVDYFAGGAPSPFQHYWTLGVEEQFYLLWPPMIVGTAWLIRRLRRRKKSADAPPAPPSKTPYLVLVTTIALSSPVKFVYWVRDVRGVEDAGHQDHRGTDPADGDRGALREPAPPGWRSGQPGHPAPAARPE
ncbi:acyltransferase [Mycobacterium sp. TY815]|uniref:acyltransferase family protein n=1 Tax=Mycobacterium sp. TY815 TaxID=3050581 RepID=UPI0027428AAE|nr:acyltransferase [Mycobacterium sp. TY815]MDP7706344.1 acyltransferase [Mycobacterium sp. TY815]